MANIKINEIVISNVNLTDSGDVLGLQFYTDSTLAELDHLFTPGTSPEFRIVDDAENVIGVYKNRKLLSLRVDAGEEQNEVNLMMQVTPAEIEEVEVLTAKVAEQATVIAEQATKIGTQEEQIAELHNELNETKNVLVETQNELAATKATLVETQEALAEAQAANEMLTECVLEISEVVYA